MIQSDIISMLISFGVQGLTIRKVEERSYLFDFQKWNKKKLDTAFGEPRIVKEKVYAYTIPDIGSLGINPSALKLKFVDKTKIDKLQTKDEHLSFVKVTPELTSEFYRAAGNPGFRVHYLTNLWKFLNTEKFGGQMTLPKIHMKDTNGRNRAYHRGAYTSGWTRGPGEIACSSYIFNAREPFLLEIFLHEMVHQYIWEIVQLPVDKIRVEKGHGPEWKAEMVKVGLDPRRYDPTESDEYLPPKEKEMKQILRNQGTK